jgi:hypothetical protein
MSHFDLDELVVIEVVKQRHITNEFLDNIVAITIVVDIVDALHVGIGLKFAISMVPIKPT